MPESSFFLQQVIVQISPPWVHGFNGLELPGALPVLNCFLAADGRLHCLVYLVPDQVRDAILAGESFDDVLFVFPDPLHQIGSDTGVQRPVPFASQKVNTRLSRHTGLLA